MRMKVVIVVGNRYFMMFYRFGMNMRFSRKLMLMFIVSVSGRVRSVVLLFELCSVL